MRRPSGFDREPEPRAQHVPAADDWDAPAARLDRAGAADAAGLEPNVSAPSELDDELAFPGLDDEPAQAKRRARSLPALRWPLRRRTERAVDAGGVSADAGSAGHDHAAETVDLSGISEELAAAEADAADGLAITTDLSAVRARVAAQAPGLGAVPPSDAIAATDAPESVSDPATLTAEAPESGLRVAERQLKEAIRGRKRRDRREQRRFTWHVRQRRRPWLVAGVAVLAVAVFVVVGVFTPLMSVRGVQVAGASRVDVAAVEAALAPLAGTPLALVDQAEVHQALVPFPLIQRYTIETIPPHTLVVRLEERVPVLALPSDAGFDLVDPAGVTVEQSEARPEGVPLAEGVAATRSSAAFSEVARVLRDVPPELRAQFATATASTGQDVSFVLQSGVQVVWGEADETPRKAVVLAAILGALGERPVSLIDVSSSEAPIFR